MTDQIKLEEATKFLEMLDPNTDQFCFRTFDDDPERKNKHLTGMFEKSFGSIEAILKLKNKLGAGVFVAVNDGGQSDKEIHTIRIIVADTDGAPVDPLINALKPHMVIETSPDKFHVYWIVSDCEVGSFEPIQEAIADKYGTDPSVSNPSRVMRIPGFFHNKSEPFLTSIKQADTDLPSYTVDEVVDGLGIKVGRKSNKVVLKKKPLKSGTGINSAFVGFDPYTMPDKVPEGRRNSALLAHVGHLRKQEISENEIAKRARSFNQERCKPPMDDSEVEDIISRYAPDDDAGNQYLYQVSEPENDTDLFEPNPLDILKKYSITGQSKELEQKALEDKFALDGIAIAGQWTTIFGSANTGKTLLTLWLVREAISADNLVGKKVFYINADDNHGGLLEKLKLAERWGLQVIAPNQNEFNTHYLEGLLIKLAETGLANDITIILDTLKKFTDVMDKRASTCFGTLVRNFVAAGGTLIALAHTNKHVGANGKSIHSGTSDIMDDSDCCFIIDKISSVEQGGVTKNTVEFSNKKARGDVSQLEGFTYDRKDEQTYEELLNSVQRIEKNVLRTTKDRTKVEDQLELDNPIINTIRRAIKNGKEKKTEIINAAHDNSNESKMKVRKVLESRTGLIYELGHRWKCEKGENNRHVYDLLPVPD